MSAWESDGLHPQTVLILCVVIYLVVGIPLLSWGKWASDIKEQKSQVLTERLEREGYAVIRTTGPVYCGPTLFVNAELFVSLLDPDNKKIFIYDDMGQISIFYTQINENRCITTSVK